MGLFSNPTSDLQKFLKIIASTRNVDLRGVLPSVSRGAQRRSPLAHRAPSGLDKQLTDPIARCSGGNGLAVHIDISRTGAVL